MDEALPPLPAGATLDQSTPPLPPGAKLDTPKLPDTSGVQKMAQDNLAAPKEGEGESQPQTPQQRLDTAAGMPVSSGVKSGVQQLTPDWRSHLIDSYKAGTSSNAGDFMQSALHSIVPIVAGGVRGAQYEVNALKGAKEDIFNALQPFKADNADDGAIRKVIEGIGQYVGGPLFGVMGAATSPVSSAISVQSRPLTNLLQPNATEQQKQNIDQAIGGAITNVLLSAAPALHGKSGTQFPPGAGPWDNHPGSEIMQGIIDKDNPSSVNSQQIDQNIAQGFAKSAPAAQDFHDVAKVMSDGAIKDNSESPHQLAKETVIQRGKETGNEHAVILDENGRILHEIEGQPDTLRWTQGLTNDAYNAENSLSLHHNHPGGQALSPTDIGLLGAPGTKTVIAHSHNAETSAASLTNEMRQALDKSDESNTVLTTAKNAKRRISQIDDIANKAFNVAGSEVQKAVNSYAVEPGDKYSNTANGHVELTNLALEKAGIIDYSSSHVIKGYPKEVQDDIVNKTVEAIKGKLREYGYHDIAERRTSSNEAAKPSVLETNFGETSKGYSPEEIADTLHNIYKETGVHPDQVYADAQRDPSIASDIIAGKVPSAYDLLRDNRPPIPENVQTMMDKMDALSKERPLSKEGESQSSNPLAKIFNPAGMSESARDMATALRQGRGPENRDIASIQDAMQKYAKTFAKMSDEDRLKFIDYVENRSQGAKIDNPELQEAADKIRDVYAQVAQKIQERFPDVGLRQDYFTHQYQDEAAASKFFSDWIAKQGSERSLQQRAFPTLSEAMEAGLKPKTTNPIETVMNYVNNMGNLMAAHRSVELAREMGIADYFKPGQQPEGWVPLNGNLGELGGKTLYAPEDAARVYGNDISEGPTGPAGDILQDINRVNNFGNMLKLSASMFHFTLTTLSSMAQDVSRAMFTGTALERGKNLAQAVTPLANTLKGEKYMEASLNPQAMKELSPELQTAINKAWENNAVNLRNQDYWKASSAKDYFDIFKNGSVADEIGKAKDTFNENKLTAPVKILANEVGRVMNTISHPLMDYYIPRIKFAATIDNIHAWLKDHPDATPQEIDRATQDIGNNADNSFGEMMRDNLFWHKMTQQTLQTAFLSYSWVTGALRMVGNGIPDIGKAIMGKQELTADAKYLMGMAVTYAVSNGVMTYLKTGQAPNDPMDFIAYRTGGTTSEGKPERAFIPSHFPQYYHYLHDGLSELGNELSPTLKLVYHVIENKDFRGLPITNENNKWYQDQRWNDYTKYVMGEETPIGIQTLLQGKKRGSNLTDLERFMGMRQTPRAFTDPEGYDAMMKRVNDAEYNKKERSDKKIQSQYEETP